jgi:hypothetical protein
LQRNSDLFLKSLVIGTLLLGLMFIDAAVSQRIDRKQVQERREIVKVLALTDLCLFTEARYTRHPSMADINTPFQEHPLALEHFPSGAMMAVPAHLQSRAAR